MMCVSFEGSRSSKEPNQHRRASERECETADAERREKKEGNARVSIRALG